MLPAIEIDGRDVVQDDQVIRLEREQVGWETPRRLGANGDACLLQRLRKGVRPVLLRREPGVDHEHGPLARRAGKRFGAVVVRQRVGLRHVGLEDRFEPVHRRFAKRHLGKMHRPTRRDFNPARSARPAAVEIHLRSFVQKNEPPGDRCRGLQDNAHGDGLAGLRTGWRLHASDLHVGGDAVRDRQNVDPNTLAAGGGGRPPRRFVRIARRLVAVGDQHEALGGIGREHRQAQLDRLGDVGPLQHRHVDVVVDVLALRGGGDRDRLTVEYDQTEAVIRRLGLRGLAEPAAQVLQVGMPGELIRCRQVGKPAHGAAHVEQADDRELIVLLYRVRPGQHDRQCRQQQSAQANDDHAPHAVETDQVDPADGDHRQRNQAEQQHGGVVEMQVHGSASRLAEGACEADARSTVSPRRPK